MSVSVRDEIMGLVPVRGTREKVERWGNRWIPPTIRLFGSRANSFLAHRMSRLAQHDVAFGVLIFFNILLNLSDLTTSIVALNNGFSEGNLLVLGVSGALGLNTLTSLALMKALFVTGAAVVGLTGVRSADRGKRNLLLWCLMTSTFVFLVVSLNNFRWIVS